MRALRWPEVRERIGLSRPTIWRLEKAGQFPKRRRLTANAVGWIEADVEEWVRSRETGMGRPPSPKE